MLEWIGIDQGLWLHLLLTTNASDFIIIIVITATISHTPFCHRSLVITNGHPPMNLVLLEVLASLRKFFIASVAMCLLIMGIVKSL